MSLLSRLTDEMKAAMKAKDSRKLSVLRLLVSAVKYAQIDSQGEMSESEVEAVLRKEAKRRREAVAAYRQGGREDLAEKEEYELKVIESYLPERMDERMVRAAVKKILAEKEPASFGEAMGIVMKELKGKADGAVVRRVVEEVVDS